MIAKSRSHSFATASRAPHSRDLLAETWCFVHPTKGAGEASPHATITTRQSTALTGRGGSTRCGPCLSGWQFTGAQFFHDHRQISLFRFQIAGMAPLKAGLKDTPKLEIDIPQMIIDHRIAGHSLDGFFQPFQCFIVIAQAIIGPADRIEDGSILRPQLNGAMQHGQGFGEVEMAINPGITQIIEHFGAFGLKLQRLLQIALGEVPFLVALQAGGARKNQVQ